MTQLPRAPGSTPVAPPKRFVPRVTSCCSTARTTTPPYVPSAGPRLTTSTGRWTGSTWSRANDRPALVIVEEDGRETRRSFAEMAQRSNRVATWLRGHGVARGDRLIVMLGNQVELWETLLAAMKLGAVIIPAA